MLWGHRNKRPIYRRQGSAREEWIGLVPSYRDAWQGLSLVKGGDHGKLGFEVKRGLSAGDVSAEPECARTSPLAPEGTA
jgi:hypothetical protein